MFARDDGAGEAFELDDLPAREDFLADLLERVTVRAHDWKTKSPLDVSTGAGGVQSLNPPGAPAPSGP
jgi:hypothetical protein